MAMDILQKCYPDDDHMFIYDNATIHTKRGNGALSACHMPKSKPKNSHEWDGMDWGTGRNPKNWGVEVNVVGADGKPIYGPNGAILRHKVPMVDGTFADGSPQSFYYPSGHEFTGVFKGMAAILEERKMRGSRSFVQSVQSSSASRAACTAVVGASFSMSPISSMSSHCWRLTAKIKDSQSLSCRSSIVSSAPLSSAGDALSRYIECFLPRIRNLTLNAMFLMLWDQSHMKQCKSMSAALLPTFFSTDSYLGSLPGL